MQKKKCQWFIVSSNPRDQPQGGVVVPVIAVVEHGQIFLRDVLRYVESVSLDQLLILCQLILKRKTTQAWRERQELRLYQLYVVCVCVFEWLTVLKWCPIMMSTRLLVHPLSCHKQRKPNTSETCGWKCLKTTRGQNRKFSLTDDMFMCITLDAAQSIHPLAQGSTLIRTNPSTRLGSFSWKEET